MPAVAVKRGNVTVKIYSISNKGRQEFRLSFYNTLGKLVSKTFSDFEVAKTNAQTIAGELAAGQVDLASLSNTDRIALLRAQSVLTPLQIPVDVAAVQYAEAVKRLKGLSLLDAVEYFVSRHAALVCNKTVQQVYEELLKAKEADGLSKVHIRDLRVRCKQFAKAFKVPFSCVTGAKINEFLRNLKVEGRSRNNFRLAVITLCRFAMTNSYLPKDAIDLTAIAKAKEVSKPILIYTPDELEKLLNGGPEMQAFIALGAFAGLRSAEILRLQWESINFESGFIEVGSHITKTGSRRIVPILSAARAWLLPVAKTSGPVFPLLKIADAANRLTKATGVKWKKNGLRHSFISYRVAQIQNVNQVSLEAGNSPAMIFKHYREVVRPADAEKWFGVLPAAGIGPESVSGEMELKAA